MGLYTRDYARGDASMYSKNIRSESETVSFVKETYKLFAASMLAGATGAYVGVPIASSLSGGLFWALFILEIGLLIGLQFVKRKQGLNLAVMFAFTFVTGLTTAPLLAYTLGMSGGSIIVGNAFAMTSAIFGLMSFFAIKSKIDFTSFQKPLMIALFVIIGFSIINIFLGNPIFQIIIAGVATILFSILIIFDTQNIINGSYETPIDGAIALYLDFLNLFISLLQIFGFLNNDD